MRIPGFVAVPVLVVLITIGATGGADDREPTSQPTGFALVELFTSEGCSSCPPADRLANSIAEDARAAGSPVYVVAFHVDYWDYLGWRDPFGSRPFSDRQRAYAKAAKTERIYTPQMIVNGQAEFVGSDRSRAKREIADARGRASEARLRITEIARPEASRVTATIEVESSLGAEHLVLIAVVVEDGLTSRVERGENAGRDLRHEAVARGMTTVPIDPAAATKVAVEIPGDIKPDRASLVVYLQDRRTMEVVGATRRPLVAPFR